MDAKDMDTQFYCACTNARFRTLGPVKKSELVAEDALWFDWDRTYCMGGEL